MGIKQLQQEKSQVLQTTLDLETLFFDQENEFETIQSKI